MTSVTFHPIGIIHSPFPELRGIPIQPSAARDIRGEVEIFPEFIEGLKDLEGFSHLILIYYFHLSRKSSLQVKPYLDDEYRGVFATRAPSRPNPIGISVVRLLEIKENRLQVRGLDLAEGTPLLDLKPYVPDFDSAGKVKIGWLKKRIHKLPETRDDERFKR